MADNFSSSAIGDITRGGQTTLHFIRMFSQVIRQFFSAMVVVYSVTAIATFVAKTTEYERYLGARYATTWVGVHALGHGDRTVMIREQSGQYIPVKMDSLLSSQGMGENAKALVSQWLKSMWVALITFSIGLVVVFTYIWRSGSRQREETHLRGVQVLDGKALTAAIKERGEASKLTLAGIPLIEGSETSHITFTGVPGTGKTTLQMELLKQIRSRGDRVICFSLVGDFIEAFFREEKDTLLNPFDTRCPGWNLWSECPTPYHYDTLAASIIPDSTKGDNFWNDTARTVFSALTKKMGEEGDEDVNLLLHRLMNVPLEDLAEYLEGTPAAPLLDSAAAKTAQSIRTTAVQYASALRYLPTDSETTFNLRDWVNSDEGDDWVFLNAKPDQLASIRPLISCWLETLTNALLSLPASRTRRIWLVIDELPALQKLPSLDDFLAQGRKYGGCGVLAFQMRGQLEERYGSKAAADVLTGLTATWVAMRQNDPNTAKWISEALGDRQIMSMQESTSYGANEIRDGVSLNQQKKDERLVLPAEIMNLDNLHGYIRVPGNLPIAKFVAKWKPVPVVARAFIARELSVQSGFLLPDYDGDYDDEGAVVHGAI